jgi:electron transfer flavoprotein alpha subunit
MGLRIVSLMKQVPVQSQMRMGADGLMDRTKAKSIINVDCTFGLEQAMELQDQAPDSESLALSMGPASFEQSLRKTVAIGFDRVALLSDRGLAGSDTFATGLALATTLQKMGFHKGSKEPFVILSGRQTSDGDTAHVPSQVAENLGIPQATFVEEMEYKGDHLICKRIIEGGYQVLRLPIPCLVSISPTATACRRPSLKGAMRAKAVEIETWDLQKIGIPPERVGIVGSPTIVARVVGIQRERAAVTMMSGPGPEELVGNLVRVFQDSCGQKGPAKADAGESAAEYQKTGTEAKAQPDFPKVDFRKGASGVMTWVEVHGSQPVRSSLEILSPARKLADKLNTKVTSIVTGFGVANVASDLIAHGADEVIIVEDPRLQEYSILPVTAAISQIIEQCRPEITLFGATTSGRELAPRIASRVKTGVTADCTSLEIGEFVYRRRKSILYPCLESIRPTYGESKLATIVGFTCPQMATARPGTFSAPDPDPSREGSVSEFHPEFLPDDFRSEILETKREEGGAENLFIADIIVSGGRECGEIDDFSLVKELTQALKEQGVNADWGASRNAVDKGYAPYVRQIGQTGKTVRPKVYIAVAISGAIQHFAGIKESGKIVAINHDSQANIFGHADFGICRHYADVLPELIKKVREGFTFGVQPASL